MLAACGKRLKTACWHARLSNVVTCLPLTDPRPRRSGLAETCFYGLFVAEGRG
jgi:hypothetical protein